MPIGEGTPLQVLYFSALYSIVFEKRYQGPSTLAVQVTVAVRIYGHRGNRIKFESVFRAQLTARPDGQPLRRTPLLKFCPTPIHQSIIGLRPRSSRQMSNYAMEPFKRMYRHTRTYKILRPGFNHRNTEPRALESRGIQT